MKTWFIFFSFALGLAGAVTPKANTSHEKPPLHLDHPHTLADLRLMVDAFFQSEVFDAKAINPCISLFERHKGKTKQEVERKLHELAAQYTYFTQITSYEGSTVLSFFARYRTKAGLNESQNDLRFSYDSAGRLTMVDRGSGIDRIIELAKSEPHEPTKAR
jgi:hypothetical protein